MIVFPSHAPCLLQRDGDRTAEIDDRLGAHTGAQTAHTLAYAGSRGHSETLPLLNSRRSGAGHVGWKIGMACKGSGVRVPSAPLIALVDLQLCVRSRGTVAVQVSAASIPWRRSRRV